MNSNSFARFGKFSILIISGPISSAIFIFFILSLLLIPTRINIPLTITISSLIFWLTKYYFSTYHDENHRRIENQEEKRGEHPGPTAENKNGIEFLFAALYFVCLLIGFFTTHNSNIFVYWSDFSVSDLIRVASSMVLSFIFPGYAVISLISIRNNLEKFPKLFSGYFASVVITGLIAYITAAFGFAVSDNKNIVLAIYSIILIFYVTVNRNKLYRHILSTALYKRLVRGSLISLRRNLSIVMVFIGLFSIQTILTYYVFNGILIGDEWYHHGRSLQFINGSFKDIDSISSDYYPALFSALLSEYVVLSGVPSVNAFLSINFLMMLPVIAFYHFFRIWVPQRGRNASLIATTLFMLASGFGWIYVVLLRISDQFHSQYSILEIFRVSTLKAFDLNLANTFFATPHPSPHGIIALPAGFFLLALLKMNMSARLKFALTFIVTAVGIMAHDEFYLFVLASSILLLVYQLNKANIIYMSFLSSIVLVFLLDFLLPIKYFTVVEISGVPLIYLSLGFILVVWLLDLLKIINRISRAKNRIDFKIALNKRTRYILASVVVSIVLYLYFFTFIVWNNLSADEVAIHIDNYGQRDLPWYIFPMKFGIPGFLGLLFILSYLFNKFEKEVFVFAIIAILAFFAGPYYNEYRFGKYIMLAMVAFASLLMYRIIIHVQNLKLNMLIGGIFIGVIVTASALSLLVYTGLKVLLIDNPSYRLISGENNRFFPSSSELNFFTILKDRIINTKKDNIALVNSEYGNGLLSEKLMGFVGIPFTKIYHNPLILNASSISSLYELLEANDIGYIVIRHGDNSSKFTMPVKFAIDNFPKAYQNKDFIVLKVPEVSAPDNDPVVSVVLANDYLSTFQYDTLQYHVISNVINQSGRTHIEKNGNIILENNDTNPTVASSSLDHRGFNLIQTEFKIKQENRPQYKNESGWNNDTSLFQESSTQYTNNNLGIRWSDNFSDYSLLLTSKGLQLSAKSNNTTDPAYVIRNEGILKEDETVYNLKVLLLEKEIVVLINDLPRIHMPRQTGYTFDDTVSNIDVVAHGNNAEFGPIKVKHVFNLDKLYYDHMNNINYVISSLAISKYNYELLMMPDLSSVSKPIILPRDPTNISDSQFNKYLEFVKKGGKLTVVNSENRVEGVFARFFSINGSKLNSQYSRIVGSDEHNESTIFASGDTPVLKIPLNDKLEVHSYYSNRVNDKISPFAIEKKFPRGGHIVYMNAAGLFESISNHKSNFSAIANFSKFLKLNDNGPLLHRNPEKLKSVHSFIPVEKFTGLMELNGVIEIKSNSLFPYQNNKWPDLNLSVDKLLISNETKKIEIKNATIQQLRFYGQYSVELNSEGPMRIPSSNSFYNYIDFRLPSQSWLKIKVNPGVGGGVQIAIRNDSNSNMAVLNFTAKAEVSLLESTTSSYNPSLRFLIKNPKIDFTGNATIDSPDFSSFPLSGSRFLKIQGEISTRFNHVDDYSQRNGNLLESRYVSYLDGITVKGKTNPSDENFKIMGDISYRARNHGLQVPLQQIFFSTQNVTLLICLLGVFIVLFMIAWSKKLIQ